MINRAGQLWTREEIEQLKTEVNEGKALEEICLAHGRTPHAVLGKMLSLRWLVA